ncbi:MAG: HEAT repeat domain-containing protein, partial [Armatimonadetes bacterium]|nr:HEAT repeat domain-containing protein [Armatimonadota bacterium]
LRVRRSAAEALWRGKVKDGGAVDPLIAALAERDALLRAFAAGALGVSGDARAAEPLLTALKDEESSVRAAGAEALGRLGAARALTPLAAALSDQDVVVRRNTAEALGLLGPPALDALAPALQDGDSEVRRRAARGLGEMKDARVVELLAAVVDDRERDVRWAAVSGLERAAGRRAMEVLVDRLAQTHPSRDRTDCMFVYAALERMTGRQSTSGWLGDQDATWNGLVSDCREWLRGAQDGSQRPGFQNAIEAARQSYSAPRWRNHWKPINYEMVQVALQKALAVAQSDAERAEARLAILRNRSYDLSGADAAATREGYAAVLALPEARPDQRAQAILGIGETYVMERRYGLARQEFARAGAMASPPGWAGEVSFAVARSYLHERDLAAAGKELARLVQLEGVAEKLKLEAEAHLDAIRLALRVRANHPRLFFDADTWPAVKARALGPRRGEFEALKARVDAAAVEEIRVADHGTALMEAAFVYRVTREEALLNRIRTMLRATVDYYLTRADAAPHYYSRAGCAAALDWVWNDLTPPEREELARHLLRYVYSIYVQEKIHGTLSGVPSYYEKNLFWYAGLVALDPAVDDVEYARAVSILGHGYAHNREYLAGKLRQARDDGGVDSRLEYAYASVPNTVWSFVHTLQSGLGHQTPAELVYVGITPSHVLRNVLAVGRGRYRHFGYIDSWRHKDGAHVGLLYDHLAQFVHFFGKTQPEEAGIARHVRERLEREGVTGSGAFSVYPFLLDLEEAPPARIPANLPLARHFESLGQIFMSSGFGPDDVYALHVVGGDGEGFQNPNATHFTLYKKGYLALDSGTRAHDGPGHSSYTDQTVAHNCVLIRMPGETFAGGGSAGGVTSVNSGGQCRAIWFARPLAFENDPGNAFAYAATDATETYHEDKCARMVRQFLFLPPDHFVVFDRV